MDAFKLKIYASDHPFFVGDCESLVFPTADGLAGVQAHHRNMIVATVTGILTFRTPDGQTHEASVSDGMMRVEDNEVLILVDSAERPDEIDIARARRDADRAKEEMLQKKSMRDYLSAQASMARALNRLRVSGRSGRVD